MKNDLTFESVKVFARDYNGKKLYSLGVSGKKYQSDDWITAYMNVQFSRCTPPADKQVINITRAFLTPYEDKEGKAQVKIVVLAWEQADNGYPWG